MRKLFETNKMLQKISQLSENEIYQVIEQIHKEVTEKAGFIDQVRSQMPQLERELSQLEQEVKVLTQQLNEEQTQNSIDRQVSLLTLEQKSFQQQIKCLSYIIEDIQKNLPKNNFNEIISQLPPLSPDLKQKCEQRFADIIRTISFEWSAIDPAANDEEKDQLQSLQSSIEDEISKLSQIISNLPDDLRWNPQINESLDYSKLNHDFDIILSEFQDRSNFDQGDLSKSTLNSISIPEGKEPLILEMFSPKSLPPSKLYNPLYKKSFESKLSRQTQQNENELSILNKQIQYITSIHDQLQSHPITEEDIRGFNDSFAQQLQSMHSVGKTLPISIDETPSENSDPISEITHNFANYIEKFFPQQSASQLLEDIINNTQKALALPETCESIIPKPHVIKTSTISEDLANIVVKAQELKDISQLGPPEDALLSLVSSHSEALSTQNDIEVPIPKFEPPTISENPIPFLPSNMHYEEFRNKLYSLFPASVTSQIQPTPFSIPDFNSSTTESNPAVSNTDELEFPKINLPPNDENRIKEINGYFRELKDFPIENPPTLATVPEVRVEIEEPHIDDILDTIDALLSPEMQTARKTAEEIEILQKRFHELNSSKEEEEEEDEGYELEIEIENMEKKTKDLENDNNRLNEQIKEAKYQHSQFKNQNDKLIIQKEKLENELKDHELLIEKLENEISEVQNKIDGKRKEIDEGIEILEILYKPVIDGLRLDLKNLK